MAIPLHKDNPTVGARGLDGDGPYAGNDGTDRENLTDLNYT